MGRTPQEDGEKETDPQDPGGFVAHDLDQLLLWTMI